MAVLEASSQNEGLRRKKLLCVDVERREKRERRSRKAEKGSCEKRERVREREREREREIGDDGRDEL